LRLRIPTRRFEDRLRLLRGFDEVQKTADNLGAGLDPSERQAIDLLIHGGGAAFDLSKEPKEVHARYDTTSFRTGKKSFEPSILGKQFLMARRLIEAGCGFVTVQSAGWDMHADGNNPGVKAGMEMLGPPLDRGLSVFLNDLKDRGLLDKTLVIVTGDFGRTPRINKNGGRDHWPGLSTLALFGGSLKTGQVVGQSARDNGAPATDPVTTGNLLATVMHHLFDVGAVRVARGLPTDLLNLLSNTQPIPGTV
jgi:uncharacterized protein (DUF1501 family)